MRNPYLKIARRFDLDYGDVLHYSQWTEAGKPVITTENQFSRGVRNIVTAFRKRNDYLDFFLEVADAVDLFRKQKAGILDMDGNRCCSPSSSAAA